MRTGGEIHFLHRLLQVATAGSLLEDIPDVLRLTGRQVVLASHDAFAGLGFEFEAGTFGNFATGLGGGFIFRHARGVVGFGNLSGGKFGERGEDEFRFAHVVAQVLGFKPFHFLVGLHTDSAPFLMDKVGEDGVFLALFDIVIGPVVGELVAGFLPGHPLLDPLLAASVLLPSGAGAFEGKRGIGHFLHPLVTDLGEPELDRLRLGAGHALDEPQQSLCVGDVGEAHFAVVSGQFQLVTICNQLTSFLAEAVFKNLPVVPGGLVIRLLGQNLNDIHDGEKPGFGLLVVETADFAIFKNGGNDFHGGSTKQLPIQRTVLDGLEDVVWPDVLRA